MRFHALLKIRQHECRLREQSKIIAHETQTKLAGMRDKLADERTALINDLRTMNASSGLDVRHAMNLQRHVKYLENEITSLELSLVHAAAEVETRTSELVKASQNVRAIEILVERENSLRTSLLEKSNAREFDDLVTSQRCRERLG